MVSGDTTEGNARTCRPTRKMNLGPDFSSAQSKSRLYFQWLSPRRFSCRWLCGAALAFSLALIVLSDFLYFDGCGMGEARLIILKHVNQTPAFAGCSCCGLKFFVPKNLLKHKDADVARTYLLSKFDQHICTPPLSGPGRFSEVVGSRSTSRD